MPQFILNKSPAYHALDDFAKGYVETMFFTNCDSGDDDESRANDLGVERLTRASIEAIKRDCAAFQAYLMPDKRTARDWIDWLTTMNRPRYGNGCSDDVRAGGLFWYARQGHGVSWCDDYASDDKGGDIAEGLQTASRAFGQSYPEISRGWIHIC